MNSSKKKEQRGRLDEDGMATALSLDYVETPQHCLCPSAPNLSVNFLSMRLCDDIQLAARIQEIFCDLCGLRANSASCSRFLLDERFDSFINDKERSFKDSILTMVKNMSPEAKQTAAFARLEEVMREEMGYDGLDKREKFRVSRMKELRKDSCSSISDLERAESPSQYTQPLPILKSVQRTIRRKEQLFRECALSGIDPRVENQVTEFLSEEIPKVDANLVYQAMQQDSSLDSLFRPPGHVFCVNSSVCDLSCDAFLCPAGISSVSDKLGGKTIWKRWLKKRCNSELSNRLVGASGGLFSLKRYPNCNRIVTFREWPWQDMQNGVIPRVPFCVVGEVSLEKAALNGRRSSFKEAPSKENHVQALMETVRQFVLVALEELRRQQDRPHANRERYLLALPVVGTGGGSAGDLTGHVVEEMLLLLCNFCQREPYVDFVLVCADQATFAQAQLVRSTQLHKFPSFKLLTPSLRKDASQLAELASSGHLSLFLGAGVSMGSGLPSWLSLLNSVEDQFTSNGLPEERTLGLETGWDPLAMADILEDMTAAGPDRSGFIMLLKERICQTIADQAHLPGLLLALVLSLPSKSIVTQNYDQLIEHAMEYRNVADSTFRETLSVIPHSPVRGAHRWLLKMHGCVSTPQDIVVTGRDYATYEAGRMRALAGLVQANLMTTHFLFVGYSLKDPNYRRIIQEVRHALDPNTILSLEE